MQLTITIGLIVLIVFVILYRNKKRKEQQMGNDLESRIEANDWQGVSRILLKQLILWGALLVGLIAVLGIVWYMDRKFKYSSLVVIAFVAWRFIKLIRLYYISRYNEKALQEEVQQEEENHAFIERLMTRVEELLKNYNTTRISPDATPQAIMQMWLDAYERGKSAGFHPVLIEVDLNLLDNLEDVFADDNSFDQWQQQVLNSPATDGKELLQQGFQELREGYDADYWEAELLGDDLQYDALLDFYFDSDYTSFDNILLVEIPVQQPWQVFAHIPFGGWNDCPEEAEHMAIAKYWYEKYGAVVAHISLDTLEYYVPPILTVDTMPLAEEQLGYCHDMLQNNINLTTLARMNQASTVWSFWWD